MELFISQEETRRIIISDMVKKRGMIVPCIRSTKRAGSKSNNL